MTTTKGGIIATLKLREDRLPAYRRLAKLTTDAALAEAIGVDATTVYRVLNHKTQMSARFIAGMVDAFGSELFPQLFEVARDDTTADNESEAA
jgi:transcriptional regulator with XRE-family HTH domain